MFDPMNAMRPYVDVARSAGLRRPGSMLAALAELPGPPQEVFAVLRTHTLVRLILTNLTSSELRSALPGPLADQLEEWRARPWIKADTLLTGFRDTRDLLQAVAVPVLLLKGHYFAERLYGGLHHRPQMDVDILVKKEDAGRAVSSLRRAGFARQTRDLHSRTLTRDGWKLDLHLCLRRAPAYRIDDRVIWEQTRAGRAGDLEFITLSDEHHLVLVGLAAFEDLGQGMAKLRQLLDLFLLLRDVDAQFDWEGFFTRRRQENLDRVFVHVFSLVGSLFSADPEWPRLTSALAARADGGVEATRRAALDLVLAGRKRPQSFEWFAGVYPGSVAAYLAWFWCAGFPANLRDFAWARLGHGLRIALSRRSAGPAPGSPEQAMGRH